MMPDKRGVIVHVYALSPFVFSPVMDSETLNSHSKSSPPPPQFDIHERLESMLCSAPTNARSANWLRRLRSSRGFPHTDNTNMGQFLRTYRKHTTRKPNRVLSDPKIPDLPRINRRKSRKQQSPRRYVFSTNSDRASSPLPSPSRLPLLLPSPTPLPLPSPIPSPLPSPSPSPTPLPSRSPLPLPSRSTFPSPSSLPSLLSLLSPWTVKRKRTAAGVIRVLNVAKRVDEEGENGDWNLSVHSKTEVTIIDTSDSSWKSEKMLYRGKNVWIVGDEIKKGKGLMSDEGKGLMGGDSKKGLMIGDSKKGLMIGNENVTVQKKRKLCTLTNSHDAEDGGKKKKRNLKLCNSSKSVQVNLFRVSPRVHHMFVL